MKKATLTMLACCMAIGGFPQLDFAITGGGISRDEMRRLLVEDLDGDGNDEVYCIGTATGAGSFAGNNYATFGSNNLWETTLSSSGGSCESWLMTQLSGNPFREPRIFYNDFNLKSHTTILGSFSGSIYAGGTQLTSNGLEDLAVVIRNNLGQYTNVFNLGGTNQEVPGGLSSSGDYLWIGADFKGTTDIDQSSATQNLTSHGDYDGFVVFYTQVSNDYALQNYIHISGLGEESVKSVYGSDPLHDDVLAVAGYFEGTSTISYQSPGASTTLTALGIRDGFLLESKADGTNPRRSKISSNQSVDPVDVLYFPYNSLYAVGYHNGTTLEASDLVDFASTLTYSGTALTCDGSRNIFISKHNNDGTLAFLHSIGGSLNDEAKAMALFDGGLAITGSFMGTVDFDPGPGVFNLTSNGNKDAFVLILDLDGKFLNAFNIGGPGNDIGYTIAVDDQNNIYVGGSHQDAVDFSLGNNTAVKTSAGQEDIFIAKYGGMITGLPRIASPLSLLEVFPNPAIDLLQIRFGTPLTDHGRIVLTDLAGRVVISQELLPEPRQEVNLTALPAGVYLLEVQLGHERVTRKVVKQG